jgi:hypothetical protein
MVFRPKTSSQLIQGCWTTELQRDSFSTGLAQSEMADQMKDPREEELTVLVYNYVLVGLKVTTSEMQDREGRMMQITMNT